jgi:Domain of unknown function (DUF397)
MHMQLGGHQARLTTAKPQEHTMQNGRPASELTGVTWRKSSFSAAGNCVEFAKLGHDGEVAVRNSRFPDGPALVYTRPEIEALIQGMKSGEFDDLLV